MRSEDEVQDRIRFLLTQEINQRVDAASERLPHRCVHNTRHALDVRKMVLGEPNPDYNRLASGHSTVIGLCMYGAEDPTTWPGNICEEPIDAARCPLFEQKVSTQAVQAEFQSQIQDLGWVSENMPEVYGLLWALGSEATPSLPWWKRLFYRFLQIRPDALTRKIALPRSN